MLTPYLNFHRPCFFPQTFTDAKGRQRKRYRYENMTTPYEKLKSLPQFKHHLRQGCTAEQLDCEAMRLTDNQAAKEVTLSRQKLFEKIKKAKAA